MPAYTVIKEGFQIATAFHINLSKIIILLLVEIKYFREDETFHFKNLGISAYLCDSLKTVMNRGRFIGARQTQLRHLGLKKDGGQEGEITCTSIVGRLQLYLPQSLIRDGTWGKGSENETKCLLFHPVTTRLKKTMDEGLVPASTITSSWICHVGTTS